MNRVILVGRLARDPEMRTLASGKTVTTLSELPIPISAGGRRS
jgi:single-stranded DNA-binding protein